jgi:hypothetical protein
MSLSPYTQARLLIQRDSSPSRRDTLPAPNLPSLSSSFDASSARDVDVGSKATLMQIDIERQNLVLLPPLPAVSLMARGVYFRAASSAY